MASCVYSSGLKIVRVYAKHMHGSPKTFKWFALHELVKEKTIKRDFMEDVKANEEAIERNSMENAKADKKNIEGDLMENAEVVAGTCAVCYDDPFEDFSYDVVIVDETHLINEVSCLLPISRMKRKLILASMNVMEGMVGRLVDDKLVNPIVID